MGAGHRAKCDTGPGIALPRVSSSRGGSMTATTHWKPTAPTGGITPHPERPALYAWFDRADPIGWWLYARQVAGVDVRRAGCDGVEFRAGGSDDIVEVLCA